jgi:hypothetical protein
VKAAGTRILAETGKCKKKHTESSKRISEAEMNLNIIKKNKNY